MSSPIAARPPVFPAGPPGWPPADEAVRAALERVYRDGSWGRYEGPYVAELEARLAAHYGLRFALVCASGTFAVELALRCLGLGAGDEVLLAGYDFGGNFRAIEDLGARPVLVDVAPGAWTLDAVAAAAAVGPATRAILVSHLHGGIADLPALRRLADERGLALVEDACQVHGGKLAGRPLGAWGDVAALSFGGSKLLTAGRGGAILTDRPELAQRARVYCERGNHAFPLSELQAAVLLPQLDRLAERHARRAEAVRRLRTELREAVGLTPAVELPPDADPAYYKVAWLWRGAAPREALLAAVQREGVALDAGFRGFTRRSERRCRLGGPLPHAAEAAERTVLLHHPVLLEPPETLARLAEVLREIAERLA